MRVVILIVVLLLVVSCVAVGASNEYWNTDNVPLSMHDLLDIVKDFSNYGDVFKKTVDEFKMVLAEIGNENVWDWSSVFEHEYDDFFDWLDAVFKNTICGRFSVVLWWITKLIIATVIDSLILLVNVFELVGKILFGVPKPTP